MKVSGMMTSDGVANSLIMGTTGAMTVAVLIPFANNFKDPHPLLTLGDTFELTLVSVCRCKVTVTVCD